MASLRARPYTVNTLANVAQVKERLCQARTNKRIGFIMQRVGGAKPFYFSQAGYDDILTS